ncbi:hypothetical protein D3C81_1955560 [compost metagenome]
MQAIIASAGTSGTSGHLKARGRSGRFFLSTITANETRQNAASVPIFISSASTFSGTTAAIRPKMMPIAQVVKNGVPYLGCTSENLEGASPSRDIAKIILDCP